MDNLFFKKLIFEGRKYFIIRISDECWPGGLRGGDMGVFNGKDRRWTGKKKQ